MRKSFLITLLFIAGLYQLTAQINQPLRQEYEYDGEYGHDVMTIPGSDKAVMSYMQRDPNDDAFVLTMKLLNKDLQPVNEQKISFDRKYRTSLSYTTTTKMYVLLYSSKKGEYELAVINLADLSVKRLSGLLIKKVYVKEMIVLNDQVYLSSSVKGEGHIFILGPSGSVKRILPGVISREDMDYLDVQLVENQEQKEVVFKYKICTKKECEYRLLRFNQSGEQIGGFYSIPSPDGEKEINDVSISRVGADSYLLTGTYRATGKKASNGIYFAKISNQKFDYFQTYNFLEINNFNKHLSERTQAKIERKKERKEDKGDELNINYNVAMHDIVEYKNEYLFIGEFYYPTYRTESYTTFVNGKSVTQYRTVFDGFQYSHAAIAGFDKKGEMIWSNSFEMYLSYKPYSVKRFIRYSIENDKVELLFATGGKIKSITFNRNEIVKERSIDVVKTEDENDEIKGTYGSNLFWWYDQNYLSFGYQRIKNDEKKRGERKRNVFYINKISY